MQGKALPHNAQQTIARRHTTQVFFIVVSFNFIISFYPFLTQEVHLQVLSLQLHLRLSL